MNTGSASGCCKGDRDRLGTFPSGTGQLPVLLGSINTGGNDFTVLAGSTVTNTGPTAVTGDLGVSPGTAVTGFFTVDGGPGTVSGTIYPGGPVAAQAQSDLTVAFNDAAGRPGGIAVSGNLGGQTLAPGVHRSTSSLEITDPSGSAGAAPQGVGELRPRLVTIQIELGLHRQVFVDSFFDLAGEPWHRALQPVLVDAEHDLTEDRQRRA